MFGEMNEPSSSIISHLNACDIQTIIYVFLINLKTFPKCYKALVWWWDIFAMIGTLVMQFVGKGSSGTGSHLHFFPGDVSGPCHSGKYANMIWLILSQVILNLQMVRW
jgi:hypothetical protein